MRIAIAHDQFYTYGGAERVAVEMARHLNAPIYTMRNEDDVVPDDVDVNVLANRKGEWLMRRHYMIQDLYQMFSWSLTDELTGYDLVIENKTNPYWYIPTDEQTVVRYVHSTPRGLYDLYHNHKQGIIPAVIKITQRMLYQQVIPYADKWATNSDLVKRRLEKYFNVNDVSVIYPPVDTKAADPDLAETADSLFVIGRLASNKRVGLLREYAERYDRHIRVAGDGEQAHVLEDGPDNLEWLGYINEEQKWKELSAAKAVLFLAENEDFGMVPIEAFSSGTPVIGVDEGFTKYQIHHNGNGYLVKPNVDSIERAVKNLMAGQLTWSEDEMVEFADQFSKNAFRNRLDEFIETAVNETRIVPSWSEQWQGVKAK